MSFLLKRKNRYQSFLRFLFSRVDDVNDFTDWCYFNGIYLMPSNGSVIGEKLGITQEQLNRFYRFNSCFQLNRLSDWLLRFQIPALAFIAKRVIQLYYYMVDRKYGNVKVLEDDL